MIFSAIFQEFKDIIAGTIPFQKNLFKDPFFK